MSRQSEPCRSDTLSNGAGATPTLQTERRARPTATEEGRSVKIGLSRVENRCIVPPASGGTRHKTRQLVGAYPVLRASGRGPWRPSRLPLAPGILERARSLQQRKGSLRVHRTSAPSARLKWSGLEEEQPRVSSRYLHLLDSANFRPHRR